MPGAMSLELWLVRHGETDWNVAGRVQGHLDEPLNANGVGQAGRLAQRLRGQLFAAVYSSDLSRALETARTVAERLEGKPPVRVDFRWREQRLGVAQGLTHGEITARGIRRPLSYREAFDGAESRLDLMERVRDPLAELLAAHADGRILVFSHGGTLRAVSHLLLKDLEGRLLLGGHDNTAITKFRIAPDRTASLISYNDAAHLEPWHEPLVAPEEIGV
jgi:2,3-bisphosphoglycerate-dependent phosphoglycerate mutase